MEINKHLWAEKFSQYYLNNVMIGGIVCWTLTSALSQIHIGPHLSIWGRNVHRSERRSHGTKTRMSDSWKFRKWLIPADESAGLDQCGGWKRLSLTFVFQRLAAPTLGSTLTRVHARLEWGCCSVAAPPVIRSSVNSDKKTESIHFNKKDKIIQKKRKETKLEK